ncbi:ribonuclease D [Pasteurellaceae bacterium HPA106]|uniref:ribonuclease D n=1 Tax=Spirabiliibacterium pneumoniae TaxID=221400 RepID=UPI001AADCB41|nr:ribonuclease D [Spirabiliibacterium pneumoniae]MBE2896116.1 ribonuclease D [Spirabiliibacterium pneumoniae]
MINIPPQIDHLWIDNDTLLAKVCAQASEKSVVALDTEFIRTRTFYPQLGLIQLYDGQTLSLIDPLSIQDFSPFIALLQAKNVLKVLHACSEDLEVFAHYFNQLPRPLIDTQVMADFMGFNSSTGFASLIEHYFSISLDKGASRTDWLARPLSETQLRYAGADVYYLLPLFSQMREALPTQWQSAVMQECDYLCEKCLRQPQPEQAYLTIGNAWRLQGERLLALKLLAQWRLTLAIEEDIAPNFIIRETALFNAAQAMIKQPSALVEFDVHPQTIRRYGKKIVQLIAQAHKAPAESHPPAIEQIATQASYKKHMKLLQQQLVELVPETITKERIASRKFLHQLIKWRWYNPEQDLPLPRLLQGWRQPFGEALLASYEIAMQHNAI